MASMISKDEFRKSIADVMDRAVARLSDTMHETLSGGAPDDVDRVVRTGVLDLGEALLAEGLRQFSDSLKPTPPCCPRCNKPMRFKQTRSLVVRTALTGKGHGCRSPYFLCDECHLGVMGLRKALCLDDDGFTPFLRELSIRAGAIEPFESASDELLHTMAGVTVSGSKVHSLCADAGAAAQELGVSGELGESRLLRPGEKLYVEIDGGMVFIDREWKEVKVAVAFPSSDRVEVAKDRKELLHRRFCATLDTRDELGQQVYAMVEPYLPKRADGAPIIEGNVVVLADGAAWIKNLVEEVLPGAMILLDWYHASEHVAETAMALYPENPTQRKSWCTRQMNLLGRGEAATLLRRLVNLSMRLDAGSKQQEAVAALHCYLAERKNHLRYAYARNEGLDIGSGAIESAMDHVIQQRMKRSGMRWKRTGAAAMVGLRCAYRSTGGMNAVFRRLKEAA